jgi:hypothetical protein
MGTKSGTNTLSSYSSDRCPRLEHTEGRLRWIFWINVPTGLLAAVLSTRTQPESFAAPRPFDLPGLALASAALWAARGGTAPAQNVPEPGASVIRGRARHRRSARCAALT